MKDKLDTAEKVLEWATGDMVYEGDTETAEYLAECVAYYEAMKRVALAERMYENERLRQAVEPWLSHEKPAPSRDVLLKAMHAAMKGNKR